MPARSPDFEAFAQQMARARAMQRLGQSAVRQRQCPQRKRRNQESIRDRAVRRRHDEVRASKGGFALARGSARAAARCEARRDGVRAHAQRLLVLSVMRSCMSKGGFAAARGSARAGCSLWDESRSRSARARPGSRRRAPASGCARRTSRSRRMLEPRTILAWTSKEKRRRAAFSRVCRETLDARLYSRPFHCTTRPAEGTRGTAPCRALG